MGQESQVPYTVNNKRHLLFSEESLMLQILFPTCCCEPEDDSPPPTLRNPFHPHLCGEAPWPS